MYKVDVEETNKKLEKIRRYKGQGLTVMMVLSAITMLAYLFEERDIGMAIYFTTVFILCFVTYYLVLPLLSKIELLEEDIDRLKKATNMKDIKRY
jgi:uncharacterized membrane protein YjjP (DUF1212 family)